MNSDFLPLVEPYETMEVEPGGLLRVHERAGGPQFPQFHIVDVRETQDGSTQLCLRPLGVDSGLILIACSNAVAKKAVHELTKTARELLRQTYFYPVRESGVENRQYLEQAEDWLK